MQRFLILNEDQAKLILDNINFKILELLVSKELNATSLSEKLKVPLPTIWRRLSKLEKYGLIEVTKIERKRNFKTKYYRAKALYYALPLNIPLHPKDPLARKVLEFLSSLKKIMDDKYKKYNEIPKGIDPVDYAVILDAFVTFSTFLENEEEIRKILDEVKQRLLSLMKVTH
jgi:sugar-specific transcriptional regulator TrmB